MDLTKWFSFERVVGAAFSGIIGFFIGTLLTKLNQKRKKRNDQIQKKRERAIENLLENPDLMTDVKLDLIRYEFRCFSFLLLISFLFLLLSPGFGSESRTPFGPLILITVVICFIFLMFHVWKVIYHVRLIRETKERLGRIGVNTRDGTS
jgi:hypothetical protein